MNMNGMNESRSHIWSTKTEQLGDGPRVELKKRVKVEKDKWNVIKVGVNSTKCNMLTG